MEQIGDKILLIIRKGGSTRYQIYAILREMGVRMICFEDEADPACDQFFEEWICANSERKADELAEFIVSELRSRRIRPDGVLTFDDFGVGVCSAVASRLNLPGLPEKMVKLCQDKSQFRFFCQSQGLPSVKHEVINSLEDIERICATMSFPMVLKPRRGAGMARYVCW